MKTLPESLVSLRGDDRPGYTHRGHTVPWAQVVSESATRAELLRHFLHSSQPARIGILVEDQPEYLFWVAGSMLSGSCVVSLDPRNPQALRGANTAAASCHVIVSDENGIESLVHLGLDASRTINLKTGRYLTITNDMSDAPPDAPTLHDDRPLFSFPEHVPSSSFSTVDVSAKQVTAAANHVMRATEMTRHDICYDPLSLSHENSVLACWAPAVMAGSEIVLPESFTAASFLSDVQEFNCTYFTFAGSMISDVLDLPRSESDTDHRLRVGFGTDSTIAERQEFARRFACPIIDAEQWHSAVMFGS